jgi:hypothetical protein
MRRRSSAFVIPCLDRNRGEACPKQLIANLLHFAIAMRGSGDEIGWVLWKEGREHLGTTPANSFSAIRSHVLKRKSSFWQDNYVQAWIT